MTSGAVCRAAGVLGCSFLLLLSMAAPGTETATARELDLSDYRGKVVVVDFWASWCAPCRRSFPWLETMQKRYADQGLVVIGINEDNAPQDAAAFLEQVPVSFRIINDPEGKIARQFELIAMPSTYVFGRDGEIAERHLGFKVARQAEYEAVLRELLAGAPVAQDSSPPEKNQQ